VIDPSGIKVLVVTVALASGGHDQWIEGRYPSGQCTDRAMALAIKFKMGGYPHASTISLDCLREDDYERRAYEIRRGGRGEDPGDVHGDE
jgi:hypothetical protein